MERFGDMASANVLSDFLLSYAISVRIMERKEF